MKLRHRLMVLILAFAMLVTGSGVVSFAETMGDDISSVDMSAESVSKDADAASADDQEDADEEAAEAADNSAEEAAQDAGDALDEEAAEESGSQDADSNSDERAEAGDSSDSVEDADAADDPANETPAEENNEDAEDATAYSAGTLTYECDEYTVTLEYGKTAEIPEGTKLEVREVVADSDSKKEQKEYEGYYDTSLEQLRSETGGDSIAKLGFARFYDITLINDGTEIEPSGDVSVKFEFSEDSREKVGKKDDAEKNLRVVHITENEKTGELEAAALDINDTELSLNKKELSEASFTTDSFSVYGIVYTVDFEYEGYTFSIEGESDILISEIFERLHIDEDASKVQNVEFTDPELIKVEKTEGNWKLTSLKPFDTEEKLTITLPDKIIEIKVTDDGSGDAIAKVSDGTTTTYHTSLINPANQAGSTVKEGAFDQANTLSGEVVIELLKKGNDGTSDDTKFEGDTVGRYTLSSGFTFNNTNISSLTIKGVDAKSTLTKNQTTAPIAPMITTTGIGTVEFNKIIFNGNDKITSRVNGDSDIDGNGSGGAVKTNAATLNVSNCEFNNCQASGQGGGIYHYNTNKDVTCTIENSTFTSCRANGPGGDQTKPGGGGGVITTAQSLTVSNCNFYTCTTAARQGAGLFLKRTKGADVSTCTVTKCNFTDCVASHGGGGMESDAWHTTVTGCNFTRCKANTTSTAKGGAINVWADGQDNTSNDTSLTVTGCKFDSCTSIDNGGAIRFTAHNSNITASTFEGCSSINGNGGAVACTNNNTSMLFTTCTNCTFKDCHADSTADKCGNGGAIFTNGSSINTMTVTGTTIESCSAGKSGGAIRSGHITITGGTITNCSAGENGGAVHSTQTITMTNGSVTGCTTGGDSAAIDAQINGSGIVLSGNVVVAGNTGSSGENRDVFIRYNTDRQILIASDGIGDSANIGIYTPDRNSIYDNHGKPGKMFAWVGRNSGTPMASDYTNLDKFFNDRTEGDKPAMRGAPAVESSGSNWKYRVMWRDDYIARVSNDGGQTWTYHAYLVNSADSSTQQNGATVKEGAFDQANTLTGDVIIETLYETHDRYAMPSGATLSNATSYTFRTTTDDDWNPNKFTSVIRRGWSGGNSAMITASRPFTVDNLIFDGTDNEHTQRIGRAINATGGTLTVQNSTFQNFSNTGENQAGGGAIKSAVEATIENSTFRDCKITDSTNTHGGGAIWTNKPITIRNTTDKVVGFYKCTSNTSGGGIQVKDNNITVENTSSGSIVFENCTGYNDGGAIDVDRTGIVTINNTGTGTISCTDCTSDAGGFICNDDGTVTINNNGKIEVLRCYTKKNLDSSHAIYGGGSIFTTNLNITNGGEILFEECYTTNDEKEGGAIYTKGTASISGEGSITFKNCHGSEGGALYTGGATTIGEGQTVTFNDCYASANGGGAYFNGKATLNGDISFEDCYAGAYGGGFYLNSTDNVLTNVQVDGHKDLPSGTKNAVKGGAFFLASGKTVTVHSGEYKNSSASDDEGGAVNVGGADSVLYFDGDVVIYNNPQTAGEGVQQKNVVLDQDTNTIIQTTSTGLASNAHIGVYVTGNMGTSPTDPFKTHGDILDDFGTYDDSDGGRANLDRFTNDRVNDSNGNPLYGEVDPVNNKLIRWHGPEIVAPTGYNRNYTPFLFILLGGLVLAVVASGRCRTRQTEEAED